MQNLELKVRCLGATTLRQVEALACSAGATYVRTVKHRDTYFPTAHARLKLREWWREDDRADTASIANVAADEAVRGPLQQPEERTKEEGHESGREGAVLISSLPQERTGTRTSEYLVYPVSEPVALRALLSAALGVLVVVEKTRRFYRYGHTRIYLDEVKDLGAFVELETVVDEGITPGEASAEHAALISLLELDRLPVVPYSYSDLLSGQSD
ncbi:CYTH domain-containing protein [Thermogemmatispora sp.]|uniref:CYTH domain-containing protein n=1 Tax=Thermogemmatispora sp. TaxID=1968838 RepID=UPI001DF50942|nr:CYTH domain-containing protein [Thermogemmatispora sp.]MBX5450457.1 CYTH domain-containing protein [Thermogemmatispora sp.]